MRMEKDSYMEMPLNQDKNVPCNLENNNNDIVNSQELENQLVKDEVENPKVGMIFESEEELHNYYNKYAKHQGFGVAKISAKSRSDGKASYFSLACARNGKTKSKAKDSFHPRPSTKTNCKAKINVIAKDDGKFVISGVYLNHNHASSPGKVRHYRCNKVLNSHVKKRLELNDLAGITLRKNFHSLVVEGGGYEKLSFGERECRNYIAKARQLRLGIGDAEALGNYFCGMQNRNPNFFYMIDMDEEGRLKNVFWADARCRSTYESFRDVITFDTTYLTNKYDMPFAPFVGVNHHGQSVLFGCGLLSNEDTETYIWLFKSWLTCMLGHAPKAIITDQCKAIQAAVAKVFPKSSHRLCLWHIMQKIPVKLGGLAQYKEIKRILKSVVYESVNCDKFERSWMELIKNYKLENNDWLKSLYNDRHRWVPVYLKYFFWAGMSTTQRSESMNAFFDGYVHSKTSLKQFVEQYDSALKSKVEKENKADFASFSSTIPTVTEFSIEKQFQNVYTHDIFKHVQDEFRGLMYCNTSLIKREESISTFEVREHKFGKYDISRKEITYEVFYNTSECEVRCLCHLFEFRGILCRHAISVMLQENVNEVPSHYILDRWRKDIKRGYTFVKNIYDDCSNSEQRQRNNYLSPLLYEVQELGVESDEKCEFLMNLLKETKKKLLSFDTCCHDSQASVVGQPTVECSNKLHKPSHSQKKLLTPIKAKTKGRPPSNRKQSLVDKMAKKVFQGKQRGQIDQNELQVPKRRKAHQSIPTAGNDVVLPTISPPTSEILDKMATQESHSVNPSQHWNEMQAEEVNDFSNLTEKSFENHERFRSKTSTYGCSFTGENN
ncbi:protein FAR1-RELATED SEQUENCE 6-like isoform X2 [Cornus florida]|uniref:protein FAR1-RELATED SEQUENCE 6-like isoform X2 n=1 Tax=Cornus florida TaxID=4283 RepID=UPI00289F661F|nr:protein FAR1-RELATED SEQUENCE 6-like isoform X2 [Cornus florida]